MSLKRNQKGGGGRLYGAAGQQVAYLTNATVMRRLFFCAPVPYNLRSRSGEGFSQCLTLLQSSQKTIPIVGEKGFVTSNRTLDSFRIKRYTTGSTEMPRDLALISKTLSFSCANVSDILLFKKIRPTLSKSDDDNIRSFKDEKWLSDYQNIVTLI